ncbi:MAG: T9SS type A sorting domain-containing protein [Bacteroidales bacterium]
MKNRLLLLPGLLLIYIYIVSLSFASAQVAESFESPNAPPDQWKMIYADPNPKLGVYYNEMMHIDPQNPNQPPHYGSNPSYDTAYAGSQVFRFSSYSLVSNYNYTQYLISPPLNVSSSNDSVAFYYRQNQGSGDQFQLGWSTTTNDTSAFTYGPVVTTQSGDDQVWKLHYKNDLPPNTKYICIKYGKLNNESAYMLYVDGYYGPPVATLDAGVLAVNTPTSPGTSDISVDFINAGTTVLNNLNLNYEIDGGSTSQVPWSGTMAQDSVNTDFVLGSHNFTSGSHTIKVWSSDPNGGVDENNTNDTIYKTFLTVNYPTADAGGDDDICAGENYTVTTASATSYDSLSWSSSGSGSFINASTLSPTYFPSAADTLNGTVTLTLTAHGYPGYPDATSDATITIHPTPVVDFSGLQAEYCPNDPDQTLSPTPTGGAFSGNGMTGPTTFSPSAATDGATHNITYTYTDVYGCSNHKTRSTTVFAATNVSFSNLDADYCVDDPPSSLSTTPSSGGSFTVNGNPMAGSTFDPAAYGAGTYTVEFTYVDGNSCSYTDSQTTTVYDLPVVSIDNLNADYCQNEPAFTLQGSPSGGDFTVDGITTSQLDPSALSAGDHTVIYTYTDPASGCQNSVSDTVSIYQNPVVSLSGLDSEYCNENMYDTLNGSPSGGSFSGLGMTDSIFNPGSVPGGNNINITYSYTDANGCSGSVTHSTLVRALPNAGFSGLQSSYCEDDPVDVLSPNLAGGSFSGPGIDAAASSFDPGLAGNGSHDITYTVTDVHGCTNSSTQSTTVNPLPVVDFSLTASGYCVDKQSVTLTGNPTGGTFGGPAVTGNTFSPAAAGVGDHSIIYSYTDVSGCSNDTTKTISVHSLPDASFSGLQADYCENEAVDSLSPQLSGGFFVGKGMNNDSLFNPASAGVGTHDITYWVIDSNGCADSTSQQVEVNPVPVVNIYGLAASYCEDAADINLSGVPPGGTFSGTGMSGNTFSPGAAGTGTHQISYQYSNSYGCSAVKQRTVVVDSVPDVSFSGLKPEYCMDETPDTLSGTPDISGGVFLGKGVNGNVFDPAVATQGNWDIIYHVTTDAGCVNADTQKVSVKPLPDVFLGTDTVVCKGQVIQLTDQNNSANNYIWSTGASGDTISIIAVQDISISLTGHLNGCTSSDDIFIQVRDPQVDLGPDTVINANSFITLDAGPGFDDYTWFNGAKTQFITLDSSGIGLDTIDVFVTVMDSYGCMASDTMRLGFDKGGSIEQHAQYPVTIYPNPGTGLFNIETAFSREDVLFIYDAKGRRIQEIAIMEEKEFMSIDLSNEKQGLYYLIINKKDHTVTRKLIISR